MDDYNGLISKVQRYHSVLENTRLYRERWTNHLKALIVSELENMIKISKLQGTIEVSYKIRHLEYIFLSLGS